MFKILSNAVAQSSTNISSSIHDRVLQSNRLKMEIKNNNVLSKRIKLYLHEYNKNNSRLSYIKCLHAGLIE